MVVLQALLDILGDPTCLLGMDALLPLLEMVDFLIIFAQKSKVFICNFIEALKVCEGAIVFSS